MPMKHQVASLQELSLKSVGEFVTIFAKNIVKQVNSATKNDSKTCELFLQSLIISMRHQLSSNVPWHLYDRMAIEVLRAIKNLISEAKNLQKGKSLSFIPEINVAINLIQVITHHNLKTIEFSSWPKIMRHSLYDSLVDMTGLEILDLGSGSTGWRTSNIEKILVNAVSKMKNLRSFTLCFDCTDHIIAAVCDNCRKLNKLDVTASRSVTDRSISFLSKCHQLREIKLFSTSVTVPGYATLLLNHLNLQDIGRYDELGITLEYLELNVNSFDKPFRLKSFECRNMNMRYLYLLIKMCPYITSLSILRDERINDLSILASLRDLKELKLLSCDFYGNRVNTLLEYIGCNIISIHLEHVGVIDLDALICISQYCPNLRNLIFYNCEFSPDVVLQERKFLVPPFKFLERLKCVVDCADSHIEFILSNCINVKFVHLGSSTGIGDSTMKRIFSKNKLKKLEELKILYSNDLSMRTVHLLMQNCCNLRRLSELESWEGVSTFELNNFREQLRIRNIDLDTSPTLSLA